MHWLSKTACGVSGVLPGGGRGWAEIGDLVTARLELVPDALLSLSSESQISETCHHIAAYGLQFQKLPGSKICTPHHIATGL